MRHKNIIKSIVAVLVLLALPLSFTESSLADNSSEGEDILISKLSSENYEETLINEYMETNGFSADSKNYSQAEEAEYVYTKSGELEIKTEKLEKEDILKAVPSISTEDNKTLGLLIPPFAYFAKRF